MPSTVEITQPIRNDLLTMTSVSQFHRTEVYHTTVNNYRPSQTDSDFILALRVMNIIIGVVGLLANTFVVVVIVCCTKMHKQIANLFVVNQSIIDATSSLFLIAQIASQFKAVKLVEGELGSEVYCRLWKVQTFLWGFMTSSTYNLIVLTIERYLKIVHPSFYKTAFTRYKAKFLLATVWLFGISFQLCYNVPTTSIVGTSCWSDSNWPNETIQDVMSYVIIGIQYWLPVCVFVFAYGQIIRTLKRVGHTNNQSKYPAT